MRVLYRGDPLDLKEFAAIAKEFQSAHAEQQVVLLPDEALVWWCRAHACMLAGPPD